MSEFTHDNTVKKNIISLILIVVVLAALALGTYAWLNSRLDATRLVLTLGDKDGLTVSLSPYKIEATLSPVNSYTLGEVIDVTADNQATSGRNFKLYYEITEISSALQSSAFRYKITKSIDNGTTYTEDETGDFSSALVGTNFDIYEDDVPANSVIKYRVYIWIQELNENQSNLQNTTFIGNLMAEIDNGEQLPLAPVLDNAMIPVKISNDGTVTVVSPRDNTWYDYDTKQWANAVLVTSTNRNTYKSASNNNTPNVTIPSSEILAYYVWIPRYSYKIWTTANTTQTGNEQSIEINFIGKDTKDTGTTVDSFRTHPAFTFDNTELAGIWVGKFELSHNTLSSSTTNNNLGCTTETCANADGLRIIPNAVSLRYNTVSQYHYAARSMSKTGNAFGISDTGNTDTHIIKNSEWGAVSYLSHSIYGINSEVRLNNNNTYMSGCGASSADGAAVATCQIQYGNVTTYPQSTTGNITGVFDMSGNAGEYVMGNYNSTTKSSGFSTMPDSKYYDLYTSTTCTVAMCGGHALNETAGWHGDTADFVSASNPWFLRGGTYQDQGASGVFFRQAKDGAASQYRGSKAVMVVYQPDVAAASSINSVPTTSVKFVSSDNTYTGSSWTSQSIYVTLSITSPSIGVTGFQYSTDNGNIWDNITCDRSNGVQNSSNTYTCQSTWTIQGNKSVVFRAVDSNNAVTNSSTAVSIKYDSEGPTGSIATTKSGTTVTATLIASDTLSGLNEQYYFKVLTTDTCGVGTEGTTNFVDNEDNNVYSFTLGNDETYYICARVADNANNVSYISETVDVLDKAYLKTISENTEFKSPTYRERIKRIEVVNYINLTNAVNSWNLANDGTNTITGWIVNNSSNSNYNDLYLGSDYRIYATNLMNMLSGMTNLENINLSGLYTNEVADTSNMFSRVGSRTNTFNLNLGNHFDTRNVTNMAYMFSGLGTNTTNFNLNLGDYFNTSNVTNMYDMFERVGYNSITFSLNLGNQFNTSNVTNMSWMFTNAGTNATTYSLNLGDNFNTSKVTNMSNMFLNVGYNSTSFSLNLGNQFDTSRVNDMYQMFLFVGSKATIFSLNLGNKFNTSNVINMASMFSGIGQNAPSWDLNLGSNFDTSKVTSMGGMFSHTGKNSTNWSLNLGDKFNTSKVVDMAGMFSNAGINATNWSLNLGDKFNTSNVTDMSGMFSNAGATTTTFNLNLGNKFNTGKVVDMTTMFFNTGGNSTTWNLNLGNEFNTSKVDDMTWMFYNAGHNSTDFNLNLGNNFNTSNVINMTYMFASVAQNSTNWSLNLGNNFDTSKVANIYGIFENVGSTAAIFNLNLGNKFNTSNVTSTMKDMFRNAGANATTFSLNLGDKFDTKNVSTSMNNMFMNAGANATSFDIYIGNLLNMSNVSYTLNMFQNVGSRATTPFTINLGVGLNPYRDYNRMSNMFYRFGNNMATIYVENASVRSFLTDHNSDWGTSFSASNVLIAS